MAYLEPNSDEVKSISEYFLVNSKKILSIKGVEVEDYALTEFKIFLNQSLSSYSYSSSIGTKIISFYKSQEFYDMEHNINLFIGMWVNEAKSMNQETLSLDSFNVTKHKIFNTFCPGFIPFC